MAEIEELTCLICAFPFEANQRLRCVGVCGHDNVCSICFLRLRSIQRTFSCASCKQQLDHVICPTAATGQFTDFTIWGDNIGPDYIYDEKSQMFFPKAYHKSKVETLWAIKCIVCKQTRRDMKQLRQHYQAEHNLHMCELCIDNKQSFPSEQRIYKKFDYDNHIRKGDQDGSEGHPKCEFCRKRYYDKTGLFMHLTRDHFTCHLCDRAGIKFKYFSDYKHLEDHFRTGHQICEDPVCLAKRFVVFSNGIDLAAHSLSQHPFMQTRRSIPIHFKVRRPQNQDDKEEDEDEDTQQGGVTRSSGLFEGGMGGRARGGEWQVELPPSARDPRDATRAITQTAPDPGSFTTTGRAFEDTIEEYPALARVGGGALTIGGWGKLSTNNGKKDFPALGAAYERTGGGGGVGGGGGGGRSFSGAASGTSIRDGKVGGGGTQPASDESWAISTKEKRLKQSGGISKPPSMDYTGRSQEVEPPNLKGPDYPQLSLGPKAYRRDNLAAPAPPPVRSQPVYSSLAVLSRDDSVSYKIAGSSKGPPVIDAYGDEDSDAMAAAEAENEAAAMAIALAQIERLESGGIVPKIKEKKNAKKTPTPAAAVDGWGNAFKAVGINAPVKKLGKGLSLAKPLKKVSSSTSGDSNLGLDMKEAGVTQSRSFDDLKQIGRFQRDLSEQQYAAECSYEPKNYTKTERTYIPDDYPALGGATQPPPPPATTSQFVSSGKSDNSSVSDMTSMTPTPTPNPPPGLTVEQRNENIRAFVAMKKAASSTSLDKEFIDISSSAGDSMKVHSGSGGGGGGGSRELTSGHGGNWTKMGGVTVPSPDVPDTTFNYTAPAPISFSDQDYPSLGPGPGTHSSTSSNSSSNKNNNKGGKANYSAAALAMAASGNISPKTPADLLKAKKEKAAKKLTNQLQDLAFSKK